MSNWKNCLCCYQSYEPYTIGKESEIFHGQSAMLVRDEKGEVKLPSGLCGFCTPKKHCLVHAKYEMS